MEGVEDGLKYRGLRRWGTWLHGHWHLNWEFREVWLKIGNFSKV